MKRLDIWQTQSPDCAARSLIEYGHTPEDAAIIGVQLSSIDCRYAHAADHDERDAEVMRSCANPLVRKLPAAARHIHYACDFERLSLVNEGAKQ